MTTGPQPLGRWSSTSGTNLELVAWGTSVFFGAFVLWRKTRPRSTLWLVLYVPTATVAVFIFILLPG